MSIGQKKQYVCRLSTYCTCTKKEIINVVAFLIRTVNCITGAGAEQTVAEFFPVVVPYPCNGLLTQAVYHSIVLLL